MLTRLSRNTDLLAPLMKRPKRWKQKIFSEFLVDFEQDSYSPIQRELIEHFDLSLRISTPPDIPTPDAPTPDASTPTFSDMGAEVPMSPLDLREHPQSSASPTDSSTCRYSHSLLTGILFLFACHNALLIIFIFLI